MPCWKQVQIFQKLSLWFSLFHPFSWRVLCTRWLYGELNVSPWGMCSMILHMFRHVLIWCFVLPCVASSCFLILRRSKELTVFAGQVQARFTGAAIYDLYRAGGSRFQWVQESRDCRLILVGRSGPTRICEVSRSLTFWWLDLPSNMNHSEWLDCDAGSDLFEGGGDLSLEAYFWAKLLKKWGETKKHRGFAQPAGSNQGRLHWQHRT